MELNCRLTTFRHADIDTFLVATSGTHVAPYGLCTTFVVIGALVLGLLLKTSSEESLGTAVKRITRIKMFLNIDSGKNTETHNSKRKVQERCSGQANHRHTEMPFGAWSYNEKRRSIHIYISDPITPTLLIYSHA